MSITNVHDLKVGGLYKVTYNGRLNISKRATHTVCAGGKGEHIWYIGVVQVHQQNVAFERPMLLVTSNYFRDTESMGLANNCFSWTNVPKWRVISIEEFPVKDLPLYINYPKQPIFDQLLRGDIHVTTEQ